MKRGIIMEVQDRHWIVLTPDGEFLKVPRTDYSLDIGQEVVFDAVEPVRRQPWLVVVSVAAAAVLGFFFLFPRLLSDQAYAQSYVYVDVNPSIAIGLNDDKEVVQVKPLNDSAKKMLHHLDYRHENVDQFVLNFLKEAKREGYLHKHDQVVLTGISGDSVSSEALKDVEKTIKNIKHVDNDKLNLNIRTLSMPKLVQSKAEKAGLSPVKYAAWVLAKNEGKVIPVGKLDETPITQLAHEVKPVSDLLNQSLPQDELVKIVKEEPMPPAPAGQPAQGQPAQGQPAQNDNKSKDGKPSASQDSSTPAGTQPSGTPSSNSAPNPQPTSDSQPNPAPSSGSNAPAQKAPDTSGTGQGTSNGTQADSSGASK
jgi:hypothetical protein